MNAYFCISTCFGFNNTPIDRRLEVSSKKYICKKNCFLSASPQSRSLLNQIWPFQSSERRQEHTFSEETQNKKCRPPPPPQTSAIITKSTEGGKRSACTGFCASVQHLQWRSHTRTDQKGEITPPVMAAAFLGRVDHFHAEDTLRAF